MANETDLNTGGEILQDLYNEQITERKEVINEADLLRLMNDRADLKYITDIMPVHHDEFADHFPGRYFSTPKKMGAQTAEANINAGIAAARQIVGFLKDGCEKYRVNKK